VTAVYRTTAIRRHRAPRGFSLIELIVALAISALLLTASLVALDASFRAYRRTTEQASTHTVSRLAMHRMLALIRTSHAVGPLPDDPLHDDRHVWVHTPRAGEVEYLEIRWCPSDRSLRIYREPPPDPEGPPDEEEAAADCSCPTDPRAFSVLLSGVEASPFRLVVEDGWRVRRVTIDLSIGVDEEAATALHSEAREAIRLVGSASPRFNNP
jgi:prepilin-type N-terminal cleavage/methylation domain-containing protein